MGTLLGMYGQAGGALEDEVAAKKKELQLLKDQWAAEKSEERRAKLKKTMEGVQSSIDSAQAKMKELLRGAADTAMKAASALGSRFSSGLSSLGSRLSSSIKSASEDLSNKYSDYKDRQAINDYIKTKQQMVRAQDKVDKKLEKAKESWEKSFNQSISSSSSSMPLRYASPSRLEF
jgi:hypothetical protein